MDRSRAWLTYFGYISLFHWVFIYDKRFSYQVSAAGVITVSYAPAMSKREGPGSAPPSVWPRCAFCLPLLAPAPGQRTGGGRSWGPLFRSAARTEKGGPRIGAQTERGGFRIWDHPFRSGARTERGAPRIDAQTQRGGPRSWDPRFRSSPKNLYTFLNTCY